MTLKTTLPSTAGHDSVEVLVLDPHEATRIGLGVLLQRESWVSRCLVAGDEERAAVLAQRNRPTVAAVDVSQIGPFAGTVVTALRAARPGIRVVLTSHWPGSVVANPRQYGAVAFVAAGASAAETIRVIRAAAYEESPLVEADAAAGEARARGGLSRRERDVLALLATGATNREIAAQLYLGPDTVKKHASSLYRKLGVRNRTEATQQAAGLLAVG